MPARLIRAEINSSRSLSRVSLEADLTFRALIVAVDDYGRIDADPLMLKAVLFPRRPGVTLESLDGWVSELAAEGCLIRYESEGRPCIALCGWEKHRGRWNRAKESHFDPPPSLSQNLPESPSASGNLPLCSCSCSRLRSGIRSRSRSRYCAVHGSPDAAPPGEAPETPEQDAPFAPSALPAPAAAAAPAPVAPEPGVNGAGPRKAKRPAERTLAPDRLSPAEKAALLEWCRGAYPTLVPELPSIAAKVLDWGRGKGVLRASWIATIRNAVRSDADRRGIRPSPPQASLPMSAEEIH